MKWAKRIGAVLAALAALVIGWRAMRSARKAGDKQAKALDQEKAQHVHKARELERESREHNDRANQELRDARDAIEKLEQQGDGGIADRAARINRRLRGA